MKNSKNNNIILGFGYWVLEFGFSWCKGKIIKIQFIECDFSNSIFQKSSADQQGIKQSQSGLDESVSFIKKYLSAVSTCLIYALNYLQQPGEQPLYTFQVGKFLETDLTSKWSEKNILRWM